MRKNTNENIWGAGEGEGGKRKGSASGSEGLKRPKVSSAIWRRVFPMRLQRVKGRSAVQGERLPRNRCVCLVPQFPAHVME